MSETQKPKRGRAKTTSKPRKRTNASSGRKGQKTTDVIHYEVKLLSLIGYTILSVFGLHTNATGPVGHFIKTLYLGLFSGVGYIFPYILFILVFFSINKNLKKIKLRYMSAGIMLLIGSTIGYGTWMQSGLDSVMAIQKLEPMSMKGLAFVYTSGQSLLGGGCVGVLVAYPIGKAIGALGAYLVSLVLCCISLLLMTDVTLEKIFKDSTVAAGEAARKTKERVEQIKIPERMIPEEDDDAFGELDDSSESKSRFSWFNKQSIKAFDYDQYEKQEQKETPNEPAQGSLRDASNCIDAAQLEAASLLAAQEAAQSLSNDSVGHLYPEGLTAEFEPSFGGLIFDAVDVDSESDSVNELAIPIVGEINNPVSEIPQTQNIQASQEVSQKSAATKKARKAVDEQPIDAEAIEEALTEGVSTVVEKPYELPSLQLLDPVPPSKGTDKKELYGKAQLLEETLRHFNVEAKVVHITRGPSITMFELQPSPGIKVSKIVGLSDDIALSLAASQVRIIAPIPGKSAVGVEIPNDETTLVSIREVIESESFTKPGSKLAFSLGKDIQGATIVGDLAKMPHLLIAGSTGSGKSVCVNTLITSILYNAKPNEVKFLMIDPKVVELSVYNGIPHLLLPVVTDPKKAAVALNWAVQEMTRRYKLFADGQVRDVNSYNDKIAAAGGEYLPKIVVIIDELADLMMVAPNQIEDSICRLAQMARAAGIHLIVATQRPSVDVITGLIKANVPSRIAFAVSSQIDSRTILDMGGAEKLLGKGDMLYFPVGIPKPLRVQGAFVSDAEVNRVVQFVASQEMPIEYKEEILEAPSQESESTDADDLLPEVIEMVVRSGQASASMVQRRYKVGYNRAARMIDQMEERGIVGPSMGSKPREVQMTLDEWQEMQNVEE